MAEVRIKDLEVGQNYAFQVRAKDINGRTSAWSTLFEVLTNTDVTPPKPVTSLSWTVSESSFLATWTKPTQSTDNKPLYDFKDYKVVLTADSSTATYYVTQERFNFTFEMNVAAFGSPKATVQISVQARDLSGNASTAVTASASNPVPSDVTGFTAIPGLATVTLNWNQITDADLKNYQLYVGSTAGFTPDSSNLKYTGRSNSFVYSTSITATQYFKIKSVDIFNQSSNYSSTSVAAYPIDGVPDSTAPSQPSAPTVSVSTLVAQVSHDMTKQGGGNLESDVDYLEVHASSTTGFTPSSSTLRGTIDSAGVGIPVSAAFYFAATDSLTNLYWKVIAVDKSKNKSSASNQTSGLPGLILSANIVDATITNAKIANLSAAKLIAGTAIINDLFIQSGLTVSSTGYVQSSNYVAGTSGWKILANGSAEYNNVTVRGDIIAGTATDYISLMRSPEPILKVHGNTGGEIQLKLVLGSPEIDFINNVVGTDYKIETLPGGIAISPSVSGQTQMQIVQNEGLFAGNAATDAGLVVNHDDGYIYRGYSGWFIEDWQTLTLQNGWVADVEVPEFKEMADGTVILRGNLKNGTTTNGTIFATLPSGYRPPEPVRFITAEKNAGTSYRHVRIRANGTIDVFNATTAAICLDGIRFSMI